MRQEPDSRPAEASDPASSVDPGEPVPLARRIKGALGLLAGCLLGLVLVAFGITAIDGKLELFLPLAGWLVVGGLAVAVAILLVMLGVNFIYTRTTGTKAKPLAVDAESGDIELDCAPDVAAQRCRAALGQLSRECEPVPEQCTPGRIVARTAAGEKSFGEIITIDLTAGKDSTTRVKIRSSPSTTETLFDWGINAENVQTIAQYLETAAPSPSAATDAETENEPLDKSDWLAIMVLLLAGGYAGILTLLLAFWPQGLQAWSAFLDILPFNPSRLLPDSCSAPNRAMGLPVIRSLNIIIIPIVLAYIGYWTIRYRQGKSRIGPMDIFLSCAALLLFPVIFFAVCTEPGAASGWRGAMIFLRDSSYGGLLYIVFYIVLANFVAYLPAHILSRLLKRRGG